MSLYRFDLDKAIFDWQSKNNKRMTYTRLADRTGISVSSLHRLRTSPLVRPDFNTLEKICNELECDVLALLSREPSEEDSNY